MRLFLAGAGLIWFSLFALVGYGLGQRPSRAAVIRYQPGAVPLPIPPSVPAAPGDYSYPAVARPAPSSPIEEPEQAAPAPPRIPVEREVVTPEPMPARPEPTAPPPRRAAAREGIRPAAARVEPEAVP
ncbi:MAG TPA: hypothetical protein VFU47_03795, partial [Armatimonadota bacterium]|nr:hypothetical protein [Armatimonadota bacterium]